ncbi:tRNA pseudouridine(38-40) synthase TruA [Acuticoccus sp. M5D2P5]|uniref:tRNA pseudouridine(38-40) synthase TruA n=1 Tax=Acuticoccus kalidii TaxID=2910977 RepID=UPI001F3AA489|nr:tRNA pseudouridine(38-40) synthase TruA [Acuticoccus kalidii]MCF3936505.1 tRNA pseudouridine(38-40) synthase TruA [Acuticoccus kalidii]
MQRYKLVIEYDGRPFVGWQRQTNGRSVQEALEDAAERLCGAPTRVYGAGRTDTGVHASGQVAHLDFERDWKADTVRDAMNAHMRPEPVAILSASPVGPEFDARHSARKRHYLYRIVNRRPPLALDTIAWQVAVPLDHEAMDEAAKRLLGKHDFTTFRASQCQALSPVRTLDRLDVRRIGEIVTIEASARSFLHNQVRSMVGSLVEVGLGRWTADDMTAALVARSRPACGPVAPATGLILTQVDYEDG